MALAERAGLHDLARTHVRVPGSAGANADVKVSALVAGMVAGADTIDAMDLLRHGGPGSGITARMGPAVTRAITQIPDDAWVEIKYPHAIYDEEGHRWMSDAEVAEITFTAFGSLAKDKQVTARLIVRRVPDVNPANQNPLFTVYRYHAVFTNTPLAMFEAESAHRGHAIVEQVIADLKNGPLAHLPSGSFTANTAWLVCASMARS